MSIKLNCDMGESFGIWKMGLDKEVMPYIDMANLACGFHASDPFTMNESVKLAIKYNVIIGAHPGYQDLQGFGRRSIPNTPEEIKALVIYQIGALVSFCKIHNTSLSYVKPHGALYNDMMKNEIIFDAILTAIASLDVNIKLMILSTNKNEIYKNKAESYNISLIYEVFADRNYDEEGILLPRTSLNAVVKDSKEVISRVHTLKDEGYIKSINNKKLFLEADVICVHGDNEKALSFIKLLRKELEL